MEMPAVPGGPEAATGLGTVPRSSGSTREPGLRLLLLGKHGAGKSATGNSIQGREVFASRFREQAVTTECQSAHGTVRDTELMVIDTPDLFSSVSAEDQRGHLQRCAELSAPGPHALLLVIPIGNFTTEDAETFHRAKCRFGRETGKHSIVVFTRKDELGQDSLHEFVESDKALRALVQDCGGRYCAIDNKASGAERDAQVSELLCKVKGLVDQNGEQPYCLDLGKEHSELQDTMNERCDNSQGQVPRTTGDPLLNDPQSCAVRIVLLGVTGSGKSATANTILGEDKFVSKLSCHSVTAKCQKAFREWKGRNILVVDTPGFFHTEEKPDITCREISKCVLYSSPGTHAIILVLWLSRYTEEYQQVFAMVKALFGESVTRHMIILFTRKEDLGDTSVRDFIAESDEGLKNLVRECGSRCCAFSNIAGKAEKEAQVQELMQLVEKMILSQGHFTDKIYLGIEERLKQKTEALKKIFSDQLEMEIEQIEKEYAHKLQKEKEIKLIKQKYDNKIKNLRDEEEDSLLHASVNGIKSAFSKILTTFEK